MKRIFYILFIINLNSWGQADTTIDIFTFDFEDCYLGNWDYDSIDKYWPSNTYPNEGWINTNYPPEIVDYNIGFGTSRMMKLQFPNGTENDLVGINIFMRFDSTSPFESYEYGELYFSYQIYTTCTQCTYDTYKNPGVLGYPQWAEAAPPGQDTGFFHNAPSDHLAYQITYTYHHDQDGQYGDVGTLGAFGMQNNRGYTFTQRLVMNTFTGGTPNIDGIFETAVNGRWLNHETTIEWFEDEEDTLKIDGIIVDLFRNTQETADYPTSYWYLDNFRVYQLEQDFCTAKGYAYGSDTNTLGNTIYVPITLGTDTDTYDATYTAMSGTFKDTAGVGNYANLDKQLIKIHVNGADSIVITVDSCEIEDNFDLFSIIDNWSTVTHKYKVKTYTDITEGTQYTVDGEDAIIKLDSDYSTTDKGFQISYQAYGITKTPFLKGTEQAPKLDGTEQEFNLTK